MRLPLAIPLDARSGSATIDARLTNAVIENYEGRTVVAHRPGLSKLADVTGAASGVVCFDGDLISVNGTTVYSADFSSSVGDVWSSMTMPSSKIWIDTAYGNGAFVSVATEVGDYSTAAASSTDGETWTARTMPSSRINNGLAYGGGKFVAIRTDNVGVTTVASVSSNNGVSWTDHAMTYASSWAMVGYGAGLFIALVGTNAYATSPDGITWTDRTFSTVANWRYVAYGNGIFVAASTSNHVATSTDGITWTFGTRSVGSGYGSLVYGDGTFLMIGSESGVILSTNGLSWSSVATSMAAQYFAVGFSQGFVIAGETELAYEVILSSDGGATWQSATTVVSPGLWQSGATDGNTSVLVGEDANGAISNGPLTTVGTIVAGQHDFTRSPLSTVLFLKSKTNAYTYNGTTITAVSDVDYPAATTRGVSYLDGRVFVTTPTGKVFQSADEDFTTWAALEFVSAKAESDQAVFQCKYRDYIVVLKEWSIEFFYDAANATGSILAPVRNMFQLIGCANENTVRETAGTVVWMGQTKDGFGRSIYRFVDSEPQRISTVQVDKLLDADALTAVTSWTAKLGSHEFYGINLSAVSLAYDLTTGVWSVFSYLTASAVTKTITAISTSGAVTSTAHGYSDGDIIKVAATNASWNGWHVVTGVSTDAYSIQGTGTAFSGSGTSEKHAESIFPVKHSVSCGGKQIMQADNVLYEFLPDQVTDEIGAMAAKVRTVKFDGGNANVKTFAGAEIIGDKVAGFAVIRYSDDDYSTFSKYRPVDLNANRSRVRRLGSGNRRAFEILHVGDSIIRLEALELDVG